MPARVRDPDQERLRGNALHRREAALRRVATTRQLIAGGAAVAVCGLAVLIDVIAPSRAAATSPTSVSTGIGSQDGYGGYGASGGGYGGYGSAWGSQGSSGGSGSAPAASSGGGSATSGGS